MRINSASCKVSAKPGGSAVPSACFATSPVSATTESIATGAQCNVRKVNMTVSLAFLAPDLVKAAIDGQLPHGLGIARLCDLPIEWARQHQTLGLATY